MKPSLLTDLPNVAAGKRAFQSDTLGPEAKGGAMLAVDGNKDPLWNAGSCSHTTGQGTYRWWAVNLGDIYRIKAVRVTNRDNSNGGKIKLSE